MKKVLVAVGLFAVTALAPGIATSASGAVAAAAANPPVTWGVPRIVDPIHAYGEPDIKVGPNGDVLVSGPQGTGVQRSIWNVSKDNGDSWRVVNAFSTAQTAPACTLAPAVCLDINKSSLGPGGGDTEIEISRDNKIFYDDLWALSCFTSAVSTDSGATVQSSPVACSHPPADRQWMALFDPPGATSSPYKGTKPLVYLAYNNVVSGGNLDMSTDGLTFTPAVSGGGTYGDTSDNPYSDGNLLVDQSTGDVLAVVAHNAPNPDNNGLALAVGEPNADGSGQVTFH
jgi:hypothetical protein